MQTPSWQFMPPPQAGPVAGLHASQSFASLGGSKQVVVPPPEKSHASPVLQGELVTTLHVTDSASVATHEPFEPLAENGGAAQSGTTTVLGGWSVNWPGTTGVEPAAPAEPALAPAEPALAPAEPALAPADPAPPWPPPALVPAEPALVPACPPALVPAAPPVVPALSSSSSPQPIIGAATSDRQHSQTETEDLEGSIVVPMVCWGGCERLNVNRSGIDSIRATKMKPLLDCVQALAVGW